MSQPKHASKNLENAAELVADALSDFEQAASRAQRVELTSFKGIERAKEAVQDGINARDKFHAALVKLVEAVNEARERQEASAGVLQERAGEIETRFQAYRDIYERFANLGQEANAINALVLSASQAANASPESALGARGQLDEAVTRLHSVRDAAAKLFQDAKDGHFTDLAHQADALRQQVGSAASKLERVAQSLPAAPGNTAALH